MQEGKLYPQEPYKDIIIFYEMWEKLQGIAFDNISYTNTAKAPAYK